MIDRTILSQNLNDSVDLPEFFHAFGYRPEDTVFFRLFKDPEAEKKDPITGKRVPGKNIPAQPGWFRNTVPTLRQYNQNNYGVFWVVNGGGNLKADVLQAGIARAQFMEIDPSKEDLKRVEAGEVTLEDLLGDQINRIAEFPLEPSVIVRTRKSLHTYWLLNDGQIERFRALQERLAVHFRSDDTLQDENQVMRVPGFEHRKEDPVEVRIIKFDPDMRYTQDQISGELSALGIPEGVRPEPQTQRKAVASGEKIPVGERYRYVQSRIGELVGRLKSSVSAEAILEMVKADFREHCEDPESVDDWETLHLPFIRKCQQRAEAEPEDPEEWRYNLRAWQAENPGERFDSLSVGWDAVRQAGERARQAGKWFGEVLPGGNATQATQGNQGGSETASGAGTPPDPVPPASLAEVFGQDALVDVISDYRKEIPAKQWVIEGICTEGECAIISGSSKSGKSYLMTNLAIMTARGGMWLGRFQCRKSRVLYLNGENSLNDARERFHACFDALAVDPADCEQITMLCADGVLKSIEELKTVLINEIRGNRYGLCVLDPLYCFYSGSEIDEQDAKGFVSAIKTVCRETGAVIVCVHHHSKGATFYKNASNRASGSGMLQRAFSTLLDVSEIDTEEVDLPEGQRAYEFTGQPRQAPGFRINLIFDFPRWLYDSNGTIPDNALNRGRTAQARQKNRNIQKSTQVRAMLSQAIYEAFNDVVKQDDHGDYVTLGDVSTVFKRYDLEISERALSDKVDDGIAPGYQRDNRPGMRRRIRRTDWEQIPETRIPESLRGQSSKVEIPA